MSSRPLNTTATRTRRQKPWARKLREVEAATDWARVEFIEFRKNQKAPWPACHEAPEAAFGWHAQRQPCSETEMHRKWS
jgi:hypothetical protein